MTTTALSMTTTAPPSVRRTLAAVSRAAHEAIAKTLEALVLKRSTQDQQGEGATRTANAQTA